MTSSARSILLLAFAITAVACEDHRDAAPAAVRDRAQVAATAPAVAATPVRTTIVAPVANAALASSSVPTVAMQNAPSARQRTLPLAIELRAPARFERAADGTRRIRIDVHVANRTGGPVICERILFHARDGEARLDPEFDTNAIAEENPLGPEQSFDGVLTFVVPTGMQSPRSIDVSYGPRDEQVVEALRVE